MKDLKALHPRSIIVRMPNWIGDLVMATPLLIDLRRRFPSAKITAMCQKNVAPLLKQAPFIDAFFEFKRQSGPFRLFKESRTLSSFLRQGSYDLGILLPHSFSSAWHFFQGKVKKRIGYAKEGRSFLLTHSVPFLDQQKKQHLTTTYKELLCPLGIPISSTSPQLIITEKEKKEIWKRLEEFDLPSEAKLIGICPGAAFGTAKCWLPDRFRKVAKNLVEIDPNHVIVFLGDPLHQGLIKNICAGLSKRIINLSGKTTLRELASLLSICSVLLTNDSGPMHIADSLGTPLIALFGSTSPRLTGPFHQGRHVIQKQTPCSPCFKRKCPIGLPCMEKIETEEVTQAVLKQLRKTHVSV